MNVTQLTPAKRYAIDALPDLLNERQELCWTIEGWLEAGTLAVLVGPEASFKSFVAIDWALSIATGRDWQGCRVEPGRVLFVAGEGRTGVIRRMRGWCEHHEAVADDLFIGRRGIELIGTSDPDRIAELGDFKLVVIDTLARNFGAGSENSQEDMSAAIAGADRIREATGATVLIVHHAPLEGRDEGRLRPRGSSALAGAADTIFTCQYDGNSKVISLASIKQKDAPNPETQFLGFDVVDLGQTDNFGNPITTVALRATEQRPDRRKPMGANQRRLVRSLKDKANGDRELLVSVREMTDPIASSRQARKVLEQWFTEQPWARPAVGGHLVDLEALPNV